MTSGQNPGDGISSYIRDHHLSIYGSQEDPSSPAYYSNEILQEHLSEALIGSSLANLPLRTRSKVAKGLVCTALGYEIPGTSGRRSPAFPLRT